MPSDTVNYYTSCLRIERVDGYVICLTELDKDLYINDNLLISTWTSNIRQYISAAGYIPTDMQQTADNAVNNADVEGILTTVGVQREDIIGGRYDYAKLHMFIWDWKNNLIVKKLGSGRWGEVTIKDGSYVAEFRSLSQQIQQTVGRTYNPECDEQLGGPRCTIPLGLYPKKDGLVSSKTSYNELIDTTLHMPDDYWNGVTLTWTSGDNSSEASNVIDYIQSENKIILSSDMPNLIAKGDQYHIQKTEVSNSSVTEVGDINNLKDIARTEPDNYFDNDSIEFLSGNNSGNTYQILTYISKNITLTLDSTDLFILGDSYNINKNFLGTITSVSDGSAPDPYEFTDTNMVQIDGFFDNLVIEFISTSGGINDGLTATITSYLSTGDFIANDINLAGNISVGDTYKITKVFPGTITDLNLKNKFKDSSLNNVDNYYSGMTLAFSSGANNNNSEIISGFISASNIIILQSNMANNISSNDSYSIEYIRDSSTTSGISKLLLEDNSISADYTGMYLEFTSGNNEGEFRMISSTVLSTITDPGVIEFSTPFNNYIISGDKYIIVNVAGETYMSIGRVTNVIDNREFTAELTDYLDYGDGYFNYGKLEFKSGKNDSFHMEVKSHIQDTNSQNNQQIKLFLPMPFNIKIGHTFELFAGCDKKLLTCKNKFNNHINFQGFPYIPSQDQVTKFGGQ